MNNMVEIGKVPFDLEFHISRNTVLCYVRVTVYQKLPLNIKSHGHLLTLPSLLAIFYKSDYLYIEAGSFLDPSHKKI